MFIKGTECLNPDYVWDSRIVIFGLFIWVLVILVILFRKKSNKVAFWFVLIVLIIFACANSYEKVKVFPPDCKGHITGYGYTYTEKGYFTIFPEWIDIYLSREKNINLP